MHFAPIEIFTLSLHDALPILEQGAIGFFKSASLFAMARQWGGSIAVGYAVQAAAAVAALGAVWLVRSEEHTSELQSLRHLVCRLLLEKKTECQQAQFESQLAS